MLVGRDGLVESLEQSLDDGHRFITLTGPGGVGKTSMALLLQRRWVAAGGQCWFVACERWGEAATLLGHVADTLGGGAGDAGEQIVGGFAGGDGLLVLDNLEHLVAAGPAIAALVASDERVRVIVTSRVALRAAGERVQVVEPLGDAAVELFLDRVEAAGAGRPQRADPRVGEVCDLVDRLPLGIELAAARVPAFGLGGLVDLLRTSVASLDGSSNAVKDEHRSPLATVARTHELMVHPLAVTLYRRLAVVSGAFGLDLAVRLAGDVAAERATAALAELVDFHLVVRLDDRPTFRMLVVVGEHARRELGASGETQLAERYLRDWAIEASFRPDPRDVELTDGEHAAWMERVGAAYPAIRSALANARRDGDGATLRMLVRHLRPYWIGAGMLREGANWSDFAAALHAGDDAAYAELCFQSAAIADFAEGAEAALRWVDRGVPAAERSGDRYHCARLVETGAVAHASAGRLEQAEVLVRRSVALYGELGLPSFVATATSELANILAAQGDLDAADAYYAEAVAALVAHGMDRAGNMARVYWAEVVRHSGAPERSLDLLDVAERGLRDEALLADYVLPFRALAYADLGRFEQAEQLAAIALERAEKAGSPTVAAYSLLASARARSGLTPAVMPVEHLHRSIDAFVELDNNLGLVAAVEAAAATCPPGSEREALLAAANELRKRYGSRRPDTVRSRLAGVDDVAPRSASLAEIHGWIDRAAGRRPSSVPGGGEPMLSKRELEVLQLAGEGLGDRAIAEALFISVRTAQSHLAHVFTKLGVSNRTAAVAGARRLGLLA